MSESELRKIPENRVEAREFLGQADRYLRDAGIASLSNEAQQVLLHQAALCACDAILLACGQRVVGEEGGHVLRLTEALDRLPGDTDELFEALDASRTRRSEASYAAAWVPTASVQEAEEATRELLELARDYI